MEINFSFQFFNETVAASALFDLRLMNSIIDGISIDFVAYCDAAAPSLDDLGDRHNRRHWQRMANS